MYLALVQPSWLECDDVTDFELNVIITVFRFNGYSAEFLDRPEPNGNIPDRYALGSCPHSLYSLSSSSYSRLSSFIIVIIILDRYVTGIHHFHHHYHHHGHPRHHHYGRHDQVGNASMVLMKVVGVGNRQARFSIFITDTVTIAAIIMIMTINFTITITINFTVNFTIMSSSWTRSPQPSPSLQVERVQCNLMIISKIEIKKIINNKNKKGGQCGTKLARQLSVSSDSRWIILFKGNYEALFYFSQTVPCFGLFSNFVS